MAIPESQLGTWSHQGSVTQSSYTYQTIRKALLASDASYADKSFEVFLQGSYANNTNIYAESDVDVVIRLDSIFRSNIADLSLAEQQAYHGLFPNATYPFSDFKAGVFAVLVNNFGNNAVKAGNKAIIIKAEGSRRSADVIVCYQYRSYKKFDVNSPNDCTFGIIFPTPIGEVINYPKQHSENLTMRHQSTGQMLKPMVRIIKNMRCRLITDGVIADGLAPSYFIEGLLYNVPDNQFNGDFGNSFCNCLNWLRKTDRSKFVCPSKRHGLFGNSSVQWDDSKCSQFLNALVDLWNG